jgi:hypothetical protein
MQEVGERVADAQPDGIPAYGRVTEDGTAVMRVGEQVRYCFYRDCTDDDFACAQAMLHRPSR